MKKWLIWCLTVLAMVCLIPGIALNAKAESLYCRYCDKFTDCEILGYEKFDSSFHTLHIKCKSCSKENDIIDARYSEHTDDGKTPTCTTGKTCALCGAEYGVLGHDWGAWTPNGNGTHTGSCTRCSEVKTAKAVPVAQQPAPPKRSVRCVVGNTAKKTPITMLWCIPVQKPPPVRKSAGTLTTSASAAAIPPAKSCPH